MTFRNLSGGLLAGGLVFGGMAHSAPVPASLQQFVDAHCIDCHEGEHADGGIDFLELDFDLSNQETARRWILVHDKVTAGEMPPEKKPRPEEKTLADATSLLAKEITHAELQRSDVVLRRLNKREYENTVRDLFRADVRVEGLPEDTPTNGFDSVGEGLAVSAEAMQAYLEAADQVLDAVFGPVEKPEFIRHETNLLDQVDWKGNPQLEKHIGKMFRRTDDGLVIFQSVYCPTNLVNFARLRVPAGTYRGTIRARAIQSEKPVTMRIYGGDTIVNRKERHLVGYFDVPPEWTTIEFTDRLVEPGGTFQPKGYGTRDTRKDADTYPEPGIEIGDIVIEGPIEEWPPPSRAYLLGGVDLESGGFEEGENILQKIVPLAFRREVSGDEIAPYLGLIGSALEAGDSFESALRGGIKAVLCSPEFLFFEEPGSDVLGGEALASRLSYFLWDSMPDAALLALGRKGTLSDPEVIRQQVERMLQDPKAKRFSESFTGQWLDLYDIDFTEPDPGLYPEYDELLRLSIVEETRHFFREILDRDLSVLNFVDSDFTFLNGRLAKHYGIDGVEGQEFRKVSLAPDSIRGGLLGQASILKVTANGTYSSPVLRGVWVLENILGLPTSPPPDNVGSVEPDIRGTNTIREQLAQHRNVKSCAACHQKIDPPGFALECFDPIGGFRTSYRTMSEDGIRPDFQQAPFTYAWVKYRIGREVDASGQLPDGSPFSDFNEFKKLLGNNPGQLSHNLAEKLLTYGVGRKIGFSDRSEIEEIVKKNEEDGFGFRNLIHHIAQSEAFRRP